MFTSRLHCFYCSYEGCVLPSVAKASSLSSILVLVWDPPSKAWRQERVSFPETNMEVDVITSRFCGRWEFLSKYCYSRSCLFILVPQNHNFSGTLFSIFRSSSPFWVFHSWPFYKFSKKTLHLGLSEGHDWKTLDPKLNFVGWTITFFFPWELGRFLDRYDTWDRRRSAGL